MKIQITSDIHAGHWMRHFKCSIKDALDRVVPKGGADTLVVAGDIGHGMHAAQRVLVELAQRWERVVYVLGNHDYYGGVWNSSFSPPARTWCLNYANSGQFCGATLWHAPSPEAKEHMIQMSDFYEISGWVGNVDEMSAGDERHISESLPTGGVLVTHHLPLTESIAPKYAGDPLNCLFVHDIRDIITERKPKLVIHGHTHERRDYMFEETRVVCNPVGYPGENADFTPLIVDV